MSDFECFCNAGEDSFDTSADEGGRRRCRCSQRRSRASTPKRCSCSPSDIAFEDAVSQQYSRSPSPLGHENKLMKKTTTTTTTTEEQEYLSPEEDEDDYFEPEVVTCPNQTSPMYGGGIFGDEGPEEQYREVGLAKPCICPAPDEGAIPRERRVPKSRSIICRERTGLSPLRAGHERSGVRDQFPWVDKRKKQPKKKGPVMRVGEDIMLPRRPQMHGVNRTIVHPPPASERTYDVFAPVDLETGRLKDMNLEDWADISAIPGTGAEVLSAHDPVNRTCQCYGRSIRPPRKTHHVPHPGGRSRPSAVSSPKQICRIKSDWDRSLSPQGFLDY